MAAITSAMMGAYDLFERAIPHYHAPEAELGRAIRDYAADRATLDVLELGYGTGATTAEILKDPRARVVALDSLFSVAPLTRGRLGEQQHRARLVTMDCFDFLSGCPGERFDVIASGALIHNFPRDARSRLLKDAYRVLRRGGLFVNEDKYARDDLTQHALDLDFELSCFDRATRGDEGMRHVFGMWLEHYRIDELPETKMTESSGLADLRGAGFKGVHIAFRARMQAVALGFK